MGSAPQKGAKPHIVLVAYYFPPGPQIGGIRVQRFHKYLKRLGYTCHVITAASQNGDAPSDVIFVPDPLAQQWETQAATAPRSLAAYLELAMRRLMFPGQVGLVWSARVAAVCHRLFTDHPQQEFVLVCSYPSLGVLLAGILVWLRDRKPWIADFRDPIAAFVWQQPRIWDHLLERFVFRTAKAVVANAEGAAADWRKRYPWAAPKLHVIHNGFDPEEAPVAHDIPQARPKVILHAGNLYEGRNPNLIVKSLARLRASGVPGASSVQILLLGSADHRAGLEPEIYATAQLEGWLELRPAVPKTEALRITEEADFLLLLQPQSEIQVPGKIFEYICIGRPILALLPKNSAVEPILQKSGVPFVCVYTEDDAAAVDRKLAGFLLLPSSPVPYSDWFGQNFNSKLQTEQLARLVEGAT